MSKFMTAQQAALLIKDNDCVAIVGNGGGVLEAKTMYKAVEDRFLETGSPNNLTLIHAAGIGDKDAEGINRFAHEKMTKRVIGGHWGWSPRMQQLSNDNKIEAYNLPQGVIVLQYREIAGKRPGLITKIGLKTYVDPRVSGGKLNEITKEDIVELIELDGEEWLRYRPYPIDVAIIRGSIADADGNISMEYEPVNLEALSVAQAAKNSGGKVICQVKYSAQQGTLSPRNIKIPGILVDAVVVDSKQEQTKAAEYDPTLTGAVKMPLGEIASMSLTHRKIIARRAAMELEKGSVINLGFGMPDGVAAVAAEEGISQYITMTVEQGIVGGVPASGDIFGVAYNPEVILDATSQFDFYSGHGLDLTCLGLAQADKKGNVNVSKFGPTIAGCGGFIDISQTAKKCIFCGTMTAGGLKTEVKDGKLKILQEGKSLKFLDTVEHITFSGDYASESGQKVLYITERAVFEMTADGLVLSEVAPGVDIEKDILDKMEFKPLMPSKPKLMDERIFCDEPMGLRK